jgi:hypothetical protein
MATLLNLFIVDVVFNSLYGSFERKNKLLWLAILFQAYFWATYPLWLLVFYSVQFYTFEAFLMNWLIPTVSITPVLIVEGLAGGFIGYQIYRRVKKIYNF